LVDSPLEGRLSLCLITRDEEDFLPNCLASVQGVVEEIAIVDTGSKDRTVEIARRLGAVVRSLTWTDDFAAARNASLDMATGEWILVLDADEELHRDDRARLRSLLTGREAEAYLVQILNYIGEPSHPDVEISASLRLFRNRKEYRFSGVLHEQVGENILKVRPGTNFASSGLRIHHYGYLSGLRRSESGQRNLNLALAQVEKSPNDAFVRFNLGVEYMRFDRYADALPHLELARTLMPRGAMWGCKLVKTVVLCLMKLDRWDEAMTLVETGLAEYPDFTDLVYQEGVVHQHQGRLARAAGCFYQCVAMGPPPVPPYGAVEEGLATFKAHYGLGQVYEAMGRQHQAVKAYQDAFAGHPNWFLPLYRIGSILLTQGGAAMARAYLERFLDSTRPEHLLILADIFCLAGGYDTALSYLGLATQNGPVTPQVHYLRGVCFLRTGRHGAAGAELGEVPEDSPYFQQAALGLCFCYWSEDRLDEARSVLRKMRADDRTYLALAGMFRQEAAAILREGLERFPAAQLLHKALAELGDGGVTVDRAQT
jgi:glycosyltransferase involved in cell wall biosynthesis